MCSDIIQDLEIEHDESWWPFSIYHFLYLQRTVTKVTWPLFLWISIHFGYKSE